MPRRKDTNEWKTDSRGRYRRMVGWKDEDGKRVQQPFYFGTDLDQAKARYLRVKELWAHLERSARGVPDQIELEVRVARAHRMPWDSESLWVARELAAGRVQIVVPLAGGAHGDDVRLDDRQPRQAVSDGLLRARGYRDLSSGQGDLAVVHRGRAETASPAPRQCRPAGVGDACTRRSTSTSSTSRRRPSNRPRMVPS